MSPRRCGGVRWVDVPPPLAERQKPGLSLTLPFPRRPDTCQSCGLTADPSDGVAAAVWLECDAWDKPTSPPVFVVLCTPCGNRLIPPHPRMYHRLEQGAPNIGVMALCVDCDFRAGLACTSNLAKQNGGEGMAVRYDKEPIQAHVRGQGFSGFRTLYQGDPVACAGRVVSPRCELCGDGYDPMNVANPKDPRSNHGIGECVHVCEHCEGSGEVVEAVLSTKTPTRFLGDDGVMRVMGPCPTCNGRGWFRDAPTESTTTEPPK